MSEQRGDRAAEAIAHDADAPPHDGGHPGAAPDEHPEHEPGGEPLGPIDTTAWASGVVGVALGLAVVLCFVLATAGIG